MRPITFGTAAVVLSVSMLGAGAEDGKESKVALDQVPKAVLGAVKAEFPKAEVEAAETGEDDGKKFFEVELKQDGRSIDVSCSADGTILEVEKEIAAEDLPEAVTKALTATYPGAKIEEAEEVTLFEDADDEKEADDENGDDAGDAGEELVYEVEIVTADGKNVEVEVSADGKELEAEEGDAEEAGEE